MMLRRRRGPAALALTVLLSTGLAGCGGAPATAQGTVTLDGQPGSAGTISFEPADGKSPSTGTAIDNGRFELPAGSKLTPGRVKVVFVATMKTGKRIPAGPPSPPDMMVDEIRLYPPAGGKPEVREIDLKAGPNELVFELKSNPTGKK